MNIIIYRKQNDDLLNDLNYIREHICINKQYHITNLVNRPGFQVNSIDGELAINVIGFSGRPLHVMDGIKVDYFNSYYYDVSSYFKKRGGSMLNFESSVVQKINELIADYDQCQALEQLKIKSNSTLDYLRKSLDKIDQINNRTKDTTTMGTDTNYFNQLTIAGSLSISKSYIKNVIFSGPCTIVLWSDGDKTIVRCENENFDKEKGLAMAIAKKFLGTNKNKSDYFDIFKEWIPEEENVEVKTETKAAKKFYTVKELAEKEKIGAAEIRKRIRAGLYPGTIKQSGAWLVPLE